MRQNRSRIVAIGNPKFYVVRIVVPFLVIGSACRVISSLNPKTFLIKVNGRKFIRHRMKLMTPSSLSVVLVLFLVKRAVRRNRVRISLLLLVRMKWLPLK